MLCIKSCLQLLEGETASYFGLHVVLLRGAVDNRRRSPQAGRGAIAAAFALEQSAASFLSGMIESCLHTLIPVLLEVGIRQNVVVLHLTAQSHSDSLSINTFSNKPTKDCYS